MPGQASTRFVLAAAALAIVVAPARGEVLLDRDPIETDAAYLLRDHADERAFYYIPKVPRVAIWPDGRPKFTLIQYKKIGKDISGGIVHFLVTFGLTPDERLAAERELQRIVEKGRVLGPVPFVEGEFHLISSSAVAGGPFARTVVGTGKAPLLPGQEAAVSIALTEEGSTLLMESFGRRTSDVSVQFVLTYEGLTPAFRGRLTVDWEKVYDHKEISAKFGTIFSSAKISKVYDDLRENGAIVLDVLGEDQAMEALLSTAYATLTQMMFEVKPVKPEDMGKAEGGGESFLAKLIGGSSAGYHLKNVSWTGTYTVDLTRRKRDRRTLPITGNIGDLHRRFGRDPEVFRVVDLNDPAFEERTIHVLLDGEDYETFKDFINFAGVTFRRKPRRTRDYVYQDVLFDREKFAKQGNTLTYTFGRFGERGTSWVEYEHRTVWSFRGGIETQGEFVRSSAPVITLTPPYRYRRLEVLANEANLDKHTIIRVGVAFRHRYMGRTISNEVVLRTGDPLNAFYRYVAAPEDPEYEYRITYLKRDGTTIETEWKRGSSSFVSAALSAEPTESGR